MPDSSISPVNSRWQWNYRLSYFKINSKIFVNTSLLYWHCTYHVKSLDFEPCYQPISDMATDYMRAGSVSDKPNTMNRISQILISLNWNLTLLTSLHTYRHSLQYHAKHWFSSIGSQSIHSLTLGAGEEEEVGKRAGFCLRINMDISCCNTGHSSTCSDTHTSSDWISITETRSTQVHLSIRSAINLISDYTSYDTYFVFLLSIVSFILWWRLLSWSRYILCNANDHTGVR
jgi:hypothetical protein